ncbi:hypothetical protein BJ085DRAFT_22178 [Dimargaris cristalligena]|uniref:Peptidase M3A/M3B catalytic domain-containing protein n=1 Tax=Dimargaris cristalligena TaxID=215637 RepID=A0A4P9ZMT3_9FUNG|nr:hypothetical protein BJ085DRAFT_22178 [Dimargaris cristalligena]|eukprot:RKP34716.1 hypothetical protein BJ085DRAFT_22178 [Dimargaris cristalligena]
MQQLIDRIAAIPLSEVTFEKVIAPLGLIENDAPITPILAVNFLRFVSIDETLRRASEDSKARWANSQVTGHITPEIIQRIGAVYKNTDHYKLEPEDRRLLHGLYHAFYPNGRLLSATAQLRFQEIDARLNELDITFMRNVNDAVPQCLFTRDALWGVPEAILDQCEITSVGNENARRYVVHADSPQGLAVLSYAKLEATRREVALAKSRKCPTNLPIVAEAIHLRHEIAQLMGYPNYAAYALQGTMARTPGRAHQFLACLRDRLLPQGQAELDRLKAFKRKARAGLGDTCVSSDDTIYAWDLAFIIGYATSPPPDESNDLDTIRHYFPAGRVLRGMLRVFQTLLGLKFVPNKRAPVWHPEVQTWEVWESQGSGSTFLGHVYFDLFPRRHKYHHTACFKLRQGSRLPDGTYSTPACAIVANFPRSTAAHTPAFLSQSDISDLFHEMGHAMHNICSQTQYARFHGTNVEDDFCEAPSQLMESWPRQRTILRHLSCHYQTGQPIPDALLDVVLAMPDHWVGLDILQKVSFGLFDQYIHTLPDGPRVDFNAVWSGIKDGVALIRDSEPETPIWPVASSSFLFGQHEAGYYGFLWSQVYAAAMFHERFKKEGITNPRVGLEYRNKILKYGGSRDGMDMLTDFLGRSPEMRPFINKTLGLDGTATTNESSNRK